jgi:hypothetical protein
MATRILGPTGSKKRRRFLFVPVLLVACAALFYIAGAQAVHDTGTFQLDGDASSATQPGSPPIPAATDDWDKVCHQYANPLPTGGCGTTSNTSNSTSGSWASDGVDASIFTGGGSKDPQDISSWNWKDGSVPDKDNLIHAFAARYSLADDPVDVPGGTGNLGNGTACPAGTFATCEVIYFGIDRFDNSGDAQNGFWFLKSNIQTVNPSRPGGTGTFSGLHQDGDILVVSDFSIGGTTSIITVYKWDHLCTATNKPDSDCADSNLRQLETSANANCANPSPSAGDPFCGIVNPTNGTVSPWAGDYTDKSGNHSYLQGELYEAGLNLSALGLAGECFSSMVAESRASTSTTATLKDFVVAHFPQCKPSMTTLASNTGTVGPGTAVHDTATITVSGGTSPPDPTGTVTFFLCGPNTSKTACTTGGTNIGTGTLGDAGENPTTPTDGKSHADSPNVNTSAAKLAPGFYCFRAQWPGDTNYPGALSFTNNSDECFRVQDTSSMNTAQDWIPNDTATVTSANGTALNGGVVFTLYDGAITCATPGNATVLYGPETQTLTAAASPAQVSTSNSGANVVKITSGTSRVVTWKVVFTSSDDGVASPASPTCETTTMTISN